MLSLAYASLFPAIYFLLDLSLASLLPGVAFLPPKLRRSWQKPVVHSYSTKVGCTLFLFGFAHAFLKSLS